MAILEKVMQMKGNGLSESQIINLLKQEGVSPREINDALNQSKIKSTISQNREAYSDEFSNMKPSITEETNKEEANEPEVEYGEYEDENYEAPQEQAQTYYESPNPAYGYYPEYQTPAQPNATDIETINDIAEQIVEEKNTELKKQISLFNKFKDETKLDLDRINDRLLKLENTFNELQLAILKKIGEYGDDIKNISNEMRTTQDSFSKILNPLTDNIRELQKITGANKNNFNEELKNNSKAPQETNNPNNVTNSEEQRKKPGKQKPGFEEYLR